MPFELTAPKTDVTTPEDLTTPNVHTTPKPDVTTPEDLTTPNVDTTPKPDVTTPEDVTTPNVHTTPKPDVTTPEYLTTPNVETTTVLPPKKPCVNIAIPYNCEWYSNNCTDVPKQTELQPRNKKV